MNGEERRIAILDKLSKTEREISAGKMATEFSVTRQIIVADIALLRAAGYPIVAKSRGYVLERVNDGFIKRIAVKHDTDKLFDELDAPIMRVCGANIPVPNATLPEIESAPTVERLVNAALRICQGGNRYG